MRAVLTINSIIKLVYAQYPSQKRMDVVKALKCAGEGWWVSDNYLSFYNPMKHPESYGVERVPLKVDDGMIYIDLLKNGRLEGVEFNV